MKSLRKSLNGKDYRGTNATSSPQPLPAVSKPATAILPPQKVIRALASYRPQAPQELPFTKGDFFYVLSDVDSQGNYYEAHNPVTNARGLVPRNMFEEFKKNGVGARTSQVVSPGVGNMSMRPETLPAVSLQQQNQPKTQVFYAMVLHDFVAERADELDAKRGDPISVVAQSNREWFVAKPIGRLGRPGLIPVSFVEIRDPTTNTPITDVEALMDRGDLPKVEDWKRAMFNYKQNSIPLGALDDMPTRAMSMGSSFGQGQQQQPPFSPDTSAAIPERGPSPPRSPTPPPQPVLPAQLPEGILLTANVVSFHFEMDEYWFRIDATFQPYDETGQNILPDSRHLVLFRVYNDFYDFQVALLDNYPREAGREPNSTRILPYMPGPAEDVDDEITATRRAELDEYVHKLCELSGAGAKYILEDQVVREFLALKPGDVETLMEPRTEEIEALFGYDESADYDQDRRYQEEDQRYQGQEQDYGEDDRAYQGQNKQYDDVRGQLGNMQLGGRDDRSDGSDYEDDRYGQAEDKYGQQQQRQQNPSKSQYNSRTESLRNESPQRAYSPDTGTQRQPNYGSQSRSEPNNRRSDYSANEPSTSGRTRAPSNAAAVNSPPISSGNPQTAFIKIKVFHPNADDLIAIRVHPRVSHTELLQKVKARLDGVQVLQYKDDETGRLMDLFGDEDWREWLESTDKHVLYAD